MEFFVIDNYNDLFVLYMSGMLIGFGTSMLCIMVVSLIHFFKSITKISVT